MGVIVMLAALLLAGCATSCPSPMPSVGAMLTREAKDGAEALAAALRAPIHAQAPTLTLTPAVTPSDLDRAFQAGVAHARREYERLLREGR